jgi:hypothetical protein
MSLLIEREFVAKNVASQFHDGDGNLFVDRLEQGLEEPPRAQVFSIGRLTF